MNLNIKNLPSSRIASRSSVVKRTFLSRTFFISSSFRRSLSALVLKKPVKARFSSEKPVKTRFGSEKPVKARFSSDLGELFDPTF